LLPADASEHEDPSGALGTPDTQTNRIAGPQHGERARNNPW